MSQSELLAEWGRLRSASAYRIALKVREFENLLKHPGTLGHVSAYLSKFSKSENKRRHSELRAELERLGHHRLHETKAEWAGVGEKAYAVPGIRWSELMRLGRAFQQEAVIWKDPSGTVGLYNFQNGTVTLAVTATGEPAAKVEVSEDLYSRVRDVSFEYKFMFGQELPWNGRTPVTRRDVQALVEQGQLQPAA